MIFEPVPAVLEEMQTGAKRNLGPNDSEIIAREWLERIGAENLTYQGDPSLEGPPDWVGEYKGREVAVEVVGLHDREGWEREVEIAFARELQNLIEEESARGEQAPQWHSRCECDPRESQSSTGDQRAWKERVREALSTPGLVLCQPLHFG